MTRVNSGQPRNLTCFLIGSGSLLTGCAEILLGHNCRILGIISRDSANLMWAEEHDIPGHDPRGDLYRLLSGTPFDYLFSIVNSIVLTQDILRLPKKHTINYHDSLLPRYAGVHATAWAIMNMEKTHGITWHLAAKKVDAGDIVKQERVEISPADTSFILNAKCYEKAASTFELLVEDLVHDWLDRRPLDLANRTYFSLFKRPERAGVLSFDRDAAEIDACVRALTFGRLTPNRLGCPKIALDDRFVIVRKMSLAETASRKRAGTIVGISDGSIKISTSTRDVVVNQVSTVEGLPLSIGDFAQGYRIKKGRRLREMSPELASRITEFNAQTCRHEAYWVDKLKECQPVSLPYMKSGSASLPPEAVLSQFRIPEEFSAFLSRTEDGRDVSDGLLTGFAAYVGRISSSDRFDMGLRPDNRHDLPRGLFASCVPLRVDLDFSRTFADFRKVMQKELEEIKENRTFLRDVTFRYPDLQPETHARIFSSPAVSVALVDKLEDDHAENDSGLSMVISRDTGECCWAYRTDLLSDADVERMQEQFTCFLRGIADNPNRPIGSLPLMTDEERQKILVDWNSAEVDFPQNACLHRLFEDWADKRPEEIAVILEGRQLSYGQLNARANRIAHFLIKKGIGPEVCVGLCLERSMKMVAAMLGVLKAGGAYVPLDHRLPKNRLVSMLEDAGAKVLITQEKFADVFGELQIPVAFLDDKMQRFGSENEKNPSPAVSSDNLAYVIFTSGSMGRSKGVMVTHRNVVGFIFSFKEVTGGEKRRIGTTVAPFHFDTSVEEMYSTLCFGGTLHIIQPEKSMDSEYFARYLIDHRITISYILPDFLSGVAGHLGKLPGKMSLECVITGLAPKREKALQSFRNLSQDIKILNAYGPTEVTYGATAFDFQSTADPDRFAPIGVPFPNYETYIVDTRLQPVPVGITGELLIGGVGLARGYVNQPEQTSLSFISHPFADEPGRRLYRTGDLCRFLPDGNIEFLGRLDHQVKIRGYRIELGEIEISLLKHPAVKTVIAMAREDTSGSKRLVAYIVPKRGQEPTTSELRNFLKSRLPEYMIPAAFIMLETLPLMSNGKVDIRALPAPYKQRPDLDSHYMAPRTAVEKKLAEIMAKALDLEYVGIRDDFFELGGDSLQAVGMVADIENALSVKLPLAILFQSSTIEQLASAIQEGKSEKSWSSLVEIQPGGSKPPLFLIHSATGDVLFYRDMIRHLGPEWPVYGLQSQGLDGKRPVLERIEEMAASYLEGIRGVQPEGPYFLAGYCMGGLIALEMAQQLFESGQEVGFLGMIDTYNYNLISLERSFGESLVHKIQKTKFHFVNIMRLSPEQQVAYFVEKLRGAVKRESARLALNISNLSKKIRPGRGEREPVMFLEDRNDRASYAYKPRAYHGDVTLFRPQKNYRFARDPRMGWSDLVKGELEFVDLPVNPGGIFIEPYVRFLSSELRQCLNTRARVKGKTVHTKY